MADSRCIREVDDTMHDFLDAQVDWKYSSEH
jgi:hypothetical protein